MKPTLCLDFDGVIHGYQSGWKGADIIPDPPVPGAMDFIRSALKEFKVVVYSTRSALPSGRHAMQNYVREHWAVAGFPYAEFVHIEWPLVKPPAFLTIDDRAITFTGEWPDLDSLKNFKPWNKP